MYEQIKKIVYNHYIAVPICIVFIIACGVWFYSDRSSDIDTTGIRNADNELRHSREYNQQSIEYNQRVGDAVGRSQTINERTEDRINTSIELNTRTEESITTSQELAARARKDAIRAKTIIGESRSILERAEERNQKSEITTTEQ